jgi:hypothetical protein
MQAAASGRQLPFDRLSPSEIHPPGTTHAPRVY